MAVVDMRLYAVPMLCGLFARVVLLMLSRAISPSAVARIASIYKWMSNKEPPSLTFNEIE